MEAKECKPAVYDGISGHIRLSVPVVGAVLAVLFGLSLFVIDGLGIGGFELHALVEALALVFIGISFMTLCVTFCKGSDRYHWRLLMGITFVLWGVEALIPEGLLRLVVRDAVVLLFILDLFLMIMDWRPLRLRRVREATAGAQRR